MTFRPGDRVEYDSTHTHAEHNGCITYPTGKPAVLRGVYVKRIDETYSSVRVGGRKPLLVRTARLRRVVTNRSGGGEAA